MPIESSVITDAAELFALRPEWDALLLRSASYEPMLSPLWLGTWWRVFGGDGGRRLATLAFREGGRLVGLAPLLVRGHRYPPAIPFRRVELLGTGEDEADEICSEYVGPIAERGAEEDVAAALVEALVGGAIGPWDEVVLASMDGSARMPGILAEALRRAGVFAEAESVGSSPYIELPRSFAEYLRGISSSSRYLVTRSLRDFERWAGSEAELRVVSTAAELAEGRRVLFALHAERWGGGGVFASPRFRAFHDAVMPRLLEEGALELAWIEAHGAPVAAAYCVLWGKKLYFYQAGRSLEAPRGVRPGIALHALLIRRAIDAGLREYDFLEGRSRYKRQLATMARSVVRLRAVRLRDGLRERARLATARARAEGRMLRRALGDDDDGPPSVGPAPPGGPPAVLLGDINMLRCFADGSVRAIVASSDPDAPCFFSRHCEQRRLVADVHAAPEAWVADIEALGRLHEGRPVLYYGDDATLLAVSRNREALGARFRFLLPSDELVEALVDKLRFAALASALALPVPRTVTSKEASTAEEIARRVPPPCILKPGSHLGFRHSKAVLELGIGPLKALSARTSDELRRMIDRIASFSPEFVVQEYIPGGEDWVYSFHAYRDARGRTLGSFVGRKIRTYPRSAGASTYLEIVTEPELERLGFEVIERLRLNGVVKLDFKRDPRTGRFHLLEANPRFSLWNHLGAAAGVNLPLLAYGDLTGAHVEPAGRARAGMRWLSLADDARTFVRSFAPSGDLSLGRWLLSLRGPKVYDVFAWDDLSPFLVNVARAVERRARGRRAGPAP